MPLISVALMTPEPVGPKVAPEPTTRFAVVFIPLRIPLNAMDHVGEMRVGSIIPNAFKETILPESATPLLVTTTPTSCSFDGPPGTDWVIEKVL